MMFATGFKYPITLLLFEYRQPNILAENGLNIASIRARFFIFRTSKKPQIMPLFKITQMNMRNVLNILLHLNYVILNFGIPKHSAEIRLTCTIRARLYPYFHKNHRTANCFKITKWHDVRNRFN